ncbi:MAG: 30S ribosomal protein S27e [Nanohaloarchaea archaeon]|nr:30S ribosomal protein S27e [Candidatus Nanohaloarchaea archaeon]
MANNFFKVSCGECGNEQRIFSRASSEVECLVCSSTIAKPTGGKAEINGEIVEELAVE